MNELLGINWLRYSISEVHVCISSIIYIHVCFQGLKSYCSTAGHSDVHGVQYCADNTGSET